MTDFIALASDAELFFGRKSPGNGRLGDGGAVKSNADTSRTKRDVHRNACETRANPIN